MRTSGILLHISSLPSDYGIGTMGKSAYEFVDFLAKARQSYWQILPLCPTSYGDSPYQSFSTHAGNPYFIDLDLLERDGLLKKSEYCDLDFGTSPERVDYEKMYNARFGVLEKAYERFKQSDKIGFDEFLRDNEIWVSNYALFMAIKNANDGKCWNDWDNGLKFRDPHSLWLFKESHRNEVEFWEFVQFEFYSQWTKLKAYANDSGIKIIGDLPIYVAYDSADVWVSPDLFDLDEELNPRTVAGCPPDAFSPDGQLWGNPIYKWSKHRDTDFIWWAARLRTVTKLYDTVRLDHFRGFDEYFAIDADAETAAGGKWEKGPGMDLFNAVKRQLGDISIIAEDLGYLTPTVKDLLRTSAYPGMKVLEFAFDPNSDSDYLPHNHVKNSVVYIGTHDNAPIIEWLGEIDADTLEFCGEYLNSRSKSPTDIADALIRSALSSTADTAIIQMQDWLGLGEGSRMNTPSTSVGNWQWRMPSGVLTDALAEKIARLTELYRRAAKIH